jgi:hypothetical protein
MYRSEASCEQCQGVEGLELQQRQARGPLQRTNSGCPSSSETPSESNVAGLHSDCSSLGLPVTDKVCWVEDSHNNLCKSCLHLLTAKCLDIPNWKHLEATAEGIIQSVVSLSISIYMSGTYIRKSEETCYYRAKGSAVAKFGHVDIPHPSIGIVERLHNSWS